MSVDVPTLSLFLNQRRDTLKCFHLSIKSILNHKNLKKQDFIALFGNKNLEKLEDLQLNTSYVNMKGSLKTIAMACPNLKFFTLLNLIPVEICEDEIEFVVKHCKKLQKFNLNATPSSSWRPGCKWRLLSKIRLGFS